MRKILRFTLATWSFAVVVLSVIYPQQVFAQSTRAWSVINPECVETVAGGDVATIQGIGCVVVNILNVGTTVVGIAAFSMMIVGFLLYSFSGGNPKGKEAGSKTFIFAVASIVLSVCGIIFINLVTKFTGIAPATLTQFNLQIP